MDVVIGIGYDNTDSPAAFYSNVSKVVQRLGTLNAVIHGSSYSDEWGQEAGAWIAASFPSFDAYAEARARILAVGAAYNQDAVAFTVGTVDVADCPKPNKRAYRDLL